MHLIMTVSTKAMNRRAVRGIACKPCQFCQRNRKDTEGNPLNYQYFDEATNEWDKAVYCSKECRRAWRTMNMGR